MTVLIVTNRLQTKSIQIRINIARSPERILALEVEYRQLKIPELISSLESAGVLTDSALEARRKDVLKELRTLVIEIPNEIEARRSEIERGVLGRGTNSGRVGIAPGIAYLICEGKSRYISGAYVNELGIIAAREKLQNVSRVFPTITGYIRPAYIEYDWLYIGGTVGFNEGVNNNGSGFAIALGGTVGFLIGDSTHFGLFGGVVHDPSIRRLEYLSLGSSIELTRVLYPGSSATALAIGQDIPTVQEAGRYAAYGFVFSIAIN